MALFRTLRNLSLTTMFIGLVVILLAVAPAAAAVCGNGVVESGEDCDDGSQNGSLNSCCTSACTFTGKNPNLIVGDLTGVDQGYTVSGTGIHAYGVGTTSCNLGSCWVNWFSSIPEHPIIGQNMFRLENGRFEQIGQSWLKHGFTALQGSTCSSSCTAAPNGSHLGVLCSDPYSSNLNTTQSNMGPKQDVNANTGVYPYPDSRISTTGNAIFKRLQCHDVDIDPAQHAGALYFVEGQYISHDDALAKRQDDNASYRPATFGSAPNYTLSLTGTTVRQKWGIQAWKATDPTVTETEVGASEGIFFISAKATSLGGGQYHYEYAIQNVTNNRGAQTFTVPLPPGAVVTNIGFHDVDYHSGEPFDGTDWTSSVTSNSITWSTVGYGVNPNANALRWGTLYNFRFDANQAPGSSTVTIGLFKPGTPSTATATTVTPGVCGGAPNGTACNDGNLCTSTDTCQSGVCTPGTPVNCTPSDQCHSAGACNPSTGACSNPAKPDGSTCNDGNPCTATDTCHSGACTGTPVVCTAADTCHIVGVCLPATGTCTNPNAPDGTSCNDANACTQSDSCHSGACVGGSPVVCTASDVCHVAGTCIPASGTCTNPAAPDGTECNDANACTSSDACQSGSCVGTPVVCTPLDQCHNAGACDAQTGVCSNPEVPDGTQCQDGNACTAPDACASGSCVPGASVVCTPLDQCHSAGVCDSATGCSNPALADGTACDDANSCTINDACSGGACVGTGAPAPAEVQDVALGVGVDYVTTISWSPSAGSAWYDVIRGSLAALPVGPGGGDEICLDNQISGTQATDPQIPQSGDAWWYLVQGGNSCGRGTFGYETDGGLAAVQRTTTTCP